MVDGSTLQVPSGATDGQLKPGADQVAAEVLDATPHETSVQVDVSDHRCITSRLNLVDVRPTTSRHVEDREVLEE